MVTQTVTVTAPMGFHMRPASQFVHTMLKYDSMLTIRQADRLINGKSIMNVMAACIKQGAVLELQCDGPDEAKMLQEAVEFIRDRMEDWDL